MGEHLTLDKRFLVVMGIVCWAAIGLDLIRAGLEMPAKQYGWMH